VEILTSQLATKFTIKIHYTADFELSEILKSSRYFMVLALRMFQSEILKSSFYSMVFESSMCLIEILSFD